MHILNLDFLEGHDRDIVTEQIQVQQSVSNKIATELFTVPEKKQNDKRPHKVESPWDKFDIFDANNRNKSIIEHNTEDTEFYWHHLSNHGVEDQQINKLKPPLDIITELEPDTQHINSNHDSEQSYGSVGSLNYNNPNTHYSYSNGFINPTVYDKRNLNHDYQNSYQVHGGNNNIHNTYSNSNSQVTWREHAIDSDNYSQVNHSYIESHPDNSKMLSFWSKFDKIEKQSSFSTDDMNDFPQPQNTYSENDKHTSHQLENSSDLNSQHNLTTSDSKYSLQKIKNLTRDNSEIQKTSQQKIENTLLKRNNDLIKTVDLTKEVETSDNEASEISRDIGRGDIGADDFFTKPVESDILFHNEATQQTIKHNNDEGNRSHHQLNILNLEQQNAQKEEQRTLIQNQTNLYNLSGPVQNQENQLDSSINLHNRNTTLQNMSSWEQESINSRRDFAMQNEFLEQSNLSKSEQHHITDILQKNEKIEPNLHNFQQENIQEYPNSNFEQQNLHNFEQENMQEFVQQNENFEQMDVQNFEQENVQDFVQKNENLEQENLHDFGQENKEDFGQQIADTEQQHLYNFGQEELTQHTDDFERQLFHNFDQGKQISSENTQSLTQFETDQLQHNIQSHGNENKNLDGVQQENVNNFWSQYEQLNQQNIRDYSPLNADIGSQKNTFDQHNLRSFEKENETSENLSKSDKMLQQSPVNELKEETSPKFIEEHNAAERNVTQNTQNNKVETQIIVERTHEMPGFWQSLGNKFSNAKNKVVGWFRS